MWPIHVAYVFSNGEGCFLSLYWIDRSGTIWSTVAGEWAKQSFVPSWLIFPVAVPQ